MTTEHLKDCKDCQIEGTIARLLYEELKTISKQKARKLAEKVLRAVREESHGN